MSLSVCQTCGGHIPLGPDASNRCEKCGAGWDGGIFKPMTTPPDRVLVDRTLAEESIRGLNQAVAAFELNCAINWDALRRTAERMDAALTAQPPAGEKPDTETT